MATMRRAVDITTLAIAIVIVALGVYMMRQAVEMAIAPGRGIANRLGAIGYPLAVYAMAWLAWGLWRRHEQARNAVVIASVLILVFWGALLVALLFAGVGLIAAGTALDLDGASVAEWAMIAVAAIFPPGLAGWTLWLLTRPEVRGQFHEPEGSQLKAGKVKEADHTATDPHK